MKTRAAKLPQEIWVLVAASFVIALGFGLVAPALPQFARSFDVSVTAATIVISSFAFMRLVFAPMSGTLVQKLGERPVYIVGLLIVAVSTGACAFAGEYWQLLLFRSLGGIGSTMFTVSALGLIIRMSPSDSRGRVSGLYATSFLMGSIGGPLVGGALLQFGLRMPFIIYAIALVIAALVVFVSLRGSHLASPDKAVDVKSMTLTEGSSLRCTGQRSDRTSPSAGLFSEFALHGSPVRRRVPRSGSVDCGLRPDDLRRRQCVGVDRFRTTLGPLRPQALCRERPAHLWCGHIAMGFTDNLVVFFAIAAVTGVGSGLMSPAQQAAVADVVGSTARGGPVLAVFQMMSDIGGVVAPICAGLIAEYVSYSAAFAVMGAVVVVSATGWLFVPSRTKPVESVVEDLTDVTVLTVTPARTNLD